MRVTDSISFTLNQDEQEEIVVVKNPSIKSRLFIILSFFFKSNLLFKNGNYSLISSFAICAFDFLALSVSDFSCPQAAIISSPRGFLIGLE